MFQTRLVLVTRPEPGLSESLMVLKKKGWAGMACPVMEIAACPPFPPLACKAILVTSGQALPALSRQKRDKLIMTVGEKTALRARQAGFEHVESAGGNAASLMQLCLERNLTGPDVVLACGQGWQGQDYGRNIGKQLSARTVCAYKVRRKRSLPDGVIEALSKEQVESVLFYSGETVAAFLSLCPEEIKTAHLRNVRAFCYSESIARSAERSADWSGVMVGPYPPACL